MKKLHPVSVLFLILVPFCLSGCPTTRKYTVSDKEFDNVVDYTAKEIRRRDGMIAEKAKLLSERNAMFEEAMEKFHELVPYKESFKFLGKELSKYYPDLSPTSAPVEIARMIIKILQDKEILEGKVRAFEEKIQAIRDKFSGVISPEQLSVVREENRLLLRLSSDILYMSGSWSIMDKGKEVLQQIAPALMDIDTARFMVIGHTDNKKYKPGSKMNNLRLGKKRAWAVIDELILHGVPLERIAGATMGESRPIANNETKEGRALNRRIEIELIPNLLELTKVISYLMVMNWLGFDGAQAS